MQYFHIFIYSHKVNIIDKKLLHLKTYFTTLLMLSLKSNNITQVHENILLLIITFL